MSKVISHFQWFQNNYQEYAQRMGATTHHYDLDNLNPFHLEGDVWTHTVLVFQEMLRYAADNEVLALTSILHDIGKIYTRNEKHDKKRVSFYNHEAFSFFHAISILNKIEGLSKEDKIKILSLIALHGSYYDYLQLDEKMNDHQFFHELRTKFIKDKDLFLLLMQQTYFDVAGRICIPDNIDKRQVEHSYEDVYNFYQHRLNEAALVNDATSAKEDKRDKFVTFLIGLPGSGKSFYVERVLNKGKEVEILSRDDIIMELGKGKTYSDAFAVVDQKRVDKILNERYQTFLKNKSDIIIDMTNMSRKGRNAFANPVHKDEYKLKAVIFATPLDTVLQRNKKRAKEEGKKIPDHVYDLMMGRFVMPTLWEVDELSWVI